jgi:outer membrane protein OmpA-like peptidoglycan-associated protein
MLVSRLVLTAALVLATAGANAQSAPTAVKSADQITCELTGACGDEDVTSRGDARGSSIARGPLAADGSQDATLQGLPNGAAAPRPGMRTSTTRSGYYSMQTQVPAAPGQRQRLFPAGHKASPLARPASFGSSSLTVGFALDSSVLDTAGRLQAEALLAALRGSGLAGRHLVIAGHTDSIGGREYNIDLSQRRARALVDYLAANGISRSLLDPIGYGYDRPLAGLGASEPRNRRVEVVLSEVVRP